MNGPVQLEATVQAFPNEQGEQEYTPSKVSSPSNQENALFGGVSANKATLSAFRHLYNLRFAGEGQLTAVFGKKRLDWTDGSVVVYQPTELGKPPQASIPGADKAVAFPAIPEADADPVVLQHRAALPIPTDPFAAERVHQEATVIHHVRAVQHMVIHQLLCRKAAYEQQSGNAKCNHPDDPSASCSCHDNILIPAIPVSGWGAGLSGRGTSPAPPVGRAPARCRHKLRNGTSLHISTGVS